MMKNLKSFIDVDHLPYPSNSIYGMLASYLMLVHYYKRSTEIV